MTQFNIYDQKSGAEGRSLESNDSFPAVDKDCYKASRLFVLICWGQVGGHLSGRLSMDKSR